MSGSAPRELEWHIGEPLPPAVPPDMRPRGYVEVVRGGEQSRLSPRGDGAWVDRRGEPIASVDAWAWGQTPEESDARVEAARAAPRSGISLVESTRLLGGKAPRDTFYD